jgi:large subunit ribosomal protein L24
MLERVKKFQSQRFRFLMCEAGHIRGDMTDAAHRKDEDAEAEISSSFKRHQYNLKGAKMSQWIRKGDKVIVTTGNEKGKTGDVIARKGDRVLIQGINIRKKHAKRKDKSSGAGVFDMEVPIHISNVSFCNPDGQPVKVKVRESKGGGKELVYLNHGKEVSLRELRKNG